MPCIHVALALRARRFPVAFFFDEFFVSDADPGITFEVPIRGRLVPLVCKRGLSIKDKEQASQAAVTRHVDEKGRIVVDGVDDFKLTIEVLSRMLKSWPFVYRDGTPVPITPETISEFVSDGADALASAIAKAQTAQEEEATGPFDASSAAPSSAPEQQGASSLAASPSA